MQIDIDCDANIKQSSSIKSRSQYTYWSLFCR